jgi:hypothetical protein
MVHDLAADRHDELGAGREPHLAHRNGEACRRALGVGTGSEAVLRLGDADRQLAVAHALDIDALAAPPIAGPAAGYGPQAAALVKVTEPVLTLKTLQVPLAAVLPLEPAPMLAPLR